MNKLFGTLNWGILSTARTTNALIDAIRQSERSKVMAIASRSLEKAQIYAASKGIPKFYGSYEEILLDPDVEVIYNALPNSLHGVWTQKALDAGKHVLCEKPLVMNLSELKVIEETAFRNNLVVFEGLKHLHDPRFFEIQRIIKDGVLGNLLTIQSNFSFHLPAEESSNIRWDPQLGGGVLWDVGVYPNSLAIAVAQSGSPIFVSANQLINTAGIAIHFSGYLSFSNDIISTFVCDFRFPFRYQSTLITGSKGILKLEEIGPRSNQNAMLTLTSNDHIEKITLPNKDLFLGEVETMEQSVIEGMKPVITLEFSRACLRSLLGLQSSANSNQVIYLENIE